MGFNSGFKGLNTKLNRICHLLTLLGAHPIFHISRIRVKLHFSRHIFYNYSNTKFHKNPSSDSRVIPCGWTDRPTDNTKAESRFSQFFRTRLKFIPREALIPNHKKQQILKKNIPITKIINLLISILTQKWSLI